jgi:hypothetical protein
MAYPVYWFVQQATYEIADLSEEESTSYSEVWIQKSYAHPSRNLLVKMDLQALHQPIVRGQDVHERDENAIAAEPVLHAVHASPSLPPLWKAISFANTIYAGIYRDSITYSALSLDVDSTFGSERATGQDRLNSRTGLLGILGS